ncbi:MAG: substrate-binding domain-containing protein [Verrucomicrobiota bacterium]
MRRLTIGTFFRLQGPDGSRLFQGCANYASEDASIDLRCWDTSMWPTDGLDKGLGLDGVLAQIFPVMNTPASVRNPPMPVVNVSPCCAHCPLPRIYPDETGIGRAAAAYFLRRGFRHFLYCSNPSHGGDPLRYAGFKEEVEQAGFSTARVVLPGLPHEAYQLQAPRFEPQPKWLQALPRPLAILCFSDYEASFVTRTCTRARISIPDEIAIIGINDDHGWTHQSAVTISSFDPGFERLGYEAMADLVRHLRRKRALVSRTVRAFRFHPRRSTDALAIEDPLVKAALDVIEEREDSRLKVTDLVRAVGVSRRVLERRFRQKAGFSVLHAIQFSRMERAKNLLRSTEIPLKSIATATGFRDAVHMGRVFRRMLGQCPSRYRR